MQDPKMQKLENDMIWITACNEYFFLAFDVDN